MAIIKIKTGKSNTENKNINNGKYYFFDRSKIIKKSNKYIFDGEYIIVPGEGCFVPHYFKGKFDLHQRTYALQSIDNLRLLNKYLFYFIFKNSTYFLKYSVGSTVASLRTSSFSWINKHKWPNISIQKSIIDIIEPFELIINNLNKQIFLIKKLLKLSYNMSTTKYELMINYINLINEKWNNQKKYFATNGVGEFEIDFSKVINIENERPSRADVSPLKESFIFSKLIGDNKTFYFDEVPDEVFSTGFFNVSTEYVDFFSGFVLSDDFVKQKNKFSSGTTMRALNLKGLSNIKIKKPLNNKKILTTMLVKKIKIVNRINAFKKQIIKILIK